MVMIMTNRKIGVFSGTFDPVHEGHAWFINAAITELSLDEILVLVEKSPRRKSNVTDYRHRLEMTRLAFTKNKKVVIDSLSIQKNGSTHTVKETMQVIRDYAGASVQLWLLMGGDVFEYVPHWDDYQDLVRDVGFFVALRSEDDGEIAVSHTNDKLAEAKVKLVSSDRSGISSSRIRQAIKKGQQPSGLNQAVYDYIKQHQLYN